MIEPSLVLGEPADECEWRALVEKGLKGAPWERLSARTADGVLIAPLYREPDCPTAMDVSGFPGQAPFIRGAAMRDVARPWLIRQIYNHPEPERANRDVLADLDGGVSSIELRLDPSGEAGILVADGADLDLVLAEVIPEAAPIALDAGAHGLWAAELLAAKLKGVAAAGTAFNIDPIGAMMRTGNMGPGDLTDAARFAVSARETMPAASALRVDARPVHEAGGTEAQEIAAALTSAIHYVRALREAGLGVGDAARTLLFTLAAGPDILVETAKFRALRLCWARALEAFGAPPEARGAYIHAVTSQRMMTRYDAHTNILRVTTAAFAAAVGGADAMTTLPFTDALGLPTPFGRRVARNTQHVLLEECALGRVSDPAGGAWFVEKLTGELAAKAWELIQLIEAKGGFVPVLQAGFLQDLVAGARNVRQRAIAERRETITGVTDYPLLGVSFPQVEAREYCAVQTPTAPARGVTCERLVAHRWAQPFETLRAASEHDAHCPVFFATLGPLAEFSPRALWAQNFLATGGVGANGAEDEHADLEALIGAYRKNPSPVAVIAGADAHYAERAEAAARALKQAGAAWVMFAGKPGEREAGLRAAGVDQFVYFGQDAVAELTTVHTALGVGP